jgi:steroid delta-isomerase-like uncharacterized protein
MNGNRVRMFVILLLVALWLVACQAQPPAEPTPDAAATAAAIAAEAQAAEEALEAANIAVVQRFYDEYAAGNAEVILEVHPETILMHYAGFAEEVPTQALYEDLAAIKEGNPDIQAEIHSMVAAGNLVMTELTWTATHSGDIFGIPATGEAFAHPGIVFRRLEDGLIVESWEMWDDLSLFNSIGLAPSWDEATAGAPDPSVVIAAAVPEGNAASDGPGRSDLTAEEALNLANTRRFYEEFSAGNTGITTDSYAENVLMHYLGSGEEVPAAALGDDLAAIKAANPDLRAIVHDMVADGDLVMTELTWTATHSGDFFGVPATEGTLVHNGIVVRRLVDGKTVESWEIWDDLTLLNSMGYLPSWDDYLATAAEGSESGG